MAKKTPSAAARKKAAQKKVRELVKKGYRLNESGKRSETYRSATAQKKMGSYNRGLGAGTGHAAAKTAKKAAKMGPKRKKR
jgi:CRISPR/Cas system-associated endonuclease Cas3-HD